MNSSKRIIVFSLAFIAILILLALLFGMGKSRIDWRENYKEDSREPYGLDVVGDLLKDYFIDEDFITIEDSIKGVLPQYDDAGNYIFIGEALYMDSIDLRHLLDFVKAGNTAFISSKTIPFDLMFHLYYEECPEAYWDDYYSFADTSVELSFRHPNLQTYEPYQYQYLANHQVQPYYWTYIDEDFFCELEEGLVPLGYINDSLVNFTRRRMGEGYFYLHTTPLAFTNLQLLDEQGLTYMSSTFSHLQPGAIYWDNYSRVPEWLGRRRNQGQYYSGNRSLSSESPLQYILGQPPLAWAWYLLLASGLLYLIFRAKRKQRVIPVIEPNTNTSLEFITTIGRLYFLQGSHKKLALQQMKFFLVFVRDHYFLNTRVLDTDFVERLVAKSETNPELINKILLLYKNIESSSFVSENTLMEFHQILDEFYRHCK